MHRLETVDLGTYRGDAFFLVGFVEPEPVDGVHFDPDRDAEAFGVSSARSTPLRSNLEIVRLDTAHGRGPHLDRLYLPHAGPEDRRVWLEKDVTYDQMRRFVLANWRRFVDLYVRYNE